MDATHSSKEKSNLLSSKELLPRNAASEKEVKRIWTEKVLWAWSFTMWTLYNLQLVNYPEYYNLIFCLGRVLILNQSPPKGKLISLWKSVSFKGNFFDHYENVPIHKLGWPSVKLCRRQPRWKKRSSAIMNTKIFWINIKQAIIWKHFKSILNQSCKFLQRPIERCRFCVGPQSIGSQCNRRRKCFFGLKAGITLPECPIHLHSRL